GMDPEETLALVAEGENHTEEEKEALREAMASAKDSSVSALTDASGRFRFDRLPSEEGMMVTITAPGFASYRQVITGVRPGKTVFVDAALDPAGRLRGTVRDDAGQPIAGASVHALRSDQLIQGLLGGGLAYDLARTDERGEYLLDHLAAGSYR